MYIYKTRKQTRQPNRDHDKCFRKAGAITTAQAQWRCSSALNNVWDSLSIVQQRTAHNQPARAKLSRCLAALALALLAARNRAFPRVSLVGGC
mmetsp:Transcript_19206/g.39178  ORF Transcript_19206/g.39178 Transcript_19206/m.39178 type:complete len:93 (+) Transcript_19206:22-300(+)